MKYIHDEPKDPEIKKGDKVLYGVFYGLVKGFDKNGNKVVVDFSNGENIPDLINVININKVKKVENVRVEMKNDT